MFLQHYVLYLFNKTRTNSFEIEVVFRIKRDFFAYINIRASIASVDDTVCYLRSGRDLVTNRTSCSFPCFPFEPETHQGKSTEIVCCDLRITIGGCPILNSFFLRSRTDTFKISTSFRQYYPSFHTNVLCFDWYRSPFTIIPMWCIFLSHVQIQYRTSYIYQPALQQLFFVGRF